MSGNSDSNKPLHRGHRQRLRQQFLTTGLDGFSDVNVLELLLFYAIPRQDTNPIAHRLLDTFHSLSGVLDASVNELMDPGGLSENAAILLKLIIETARRQQIDRASKTQILDTTRKCGEYLVPFFYGATNEMVYVLALDAKCQVLGCARLFTGTVNSATLSVRRVVEYALRTHATSVVMAHNHTSGIAIPSQEDIRTTRLVSEALNMVDVFLVDHVVVADDDFVSMADSNLLHHSSLMD